MSCRHHKKRKDVQNVRNVSPNRGNVLGEDDDMGYWGNACCPYFPSFDDDYGDDD
ncbi:hypothetical protein GKZ89_13190 [Bacillus mangrovi]|uniref:Uncharacterized protein n=1 Tax=Metabacillus mangrovi TaxID=1491830 RepID=A0A7X2V5M9_9BACI|nr:hypothetical protein [Metabacillus mangrovi]MTH54359.1 hypothetical protein [Metabacillus mangrovi]